MAHHDGGKTTMTPRITWDENKEGYWLEVPYHVAFKEELKRRCRYQGGKGRRWDPARKAWWVRRSYYDVALSIILKHFEEVKDETVAEKADDPYAKANERFRKEREQKAREKEEEKRRREEESYWKNYYAQREREQERRAYEREQFRDFYDEVFARRDGMSLRQAFGILGLVDGCTAADAKKAYRKKVLECHPDRGGDPEIMKRVNLAWEKVQRACA